MCSPISASRPPPEFARLDNGDTLKLAECEEVLSDGTDYPPLEREQQLTLPPWGYRWVRIHRPARPTGL